MSDDQSIFRDRGDPIKPGLNKIKNTTGRPVFAYCKNQDYECYKLASNFYATREAPMTRQRTPTNAATATGTLLILLGILAIIPWGFGADRFLWIAAGTSGAGVILATVGALTPKEKR